MISPLKTVISLWPFSMFILPTSFLRYVNDCFSKILRVVNICVDDINVYRKTAKCLPANISSNFTLSTQLDEVACQMKYLQYQENTISSLQTLIKLKMKYCSRIRLIPSQSTLPSLERVQKNLCGLVSAEQFSNLQPISHRRSVSSLSRLCDYFLIWCLKYILGCQRSRPSCVGQSTESSLTLY